ncbi:hypothetical protein PWT90_09021 [Aphanocladium album]|nr:hypothetical protein PWT90_09021 [Aphanocladium album]
MADLKAQGFKNVFEEYADDSRIVYITSQPEIGIGQRAALLRTRAGNIPWDCITLLDDETVQHIQGRGGLRAIVFSHPHFYGAHVQWACVFGCPVFLAAADAKWRTMRSGHHALSTDLETEILDIGDKVIRVGGHFPGSIVLLYDRHVFIADTLMMTPAGGLATGRLMRWGSLGSGLLHVELAKQNPAGAGRNCSDVVNCLQL